MTAWIKRGVREQIGLGTDYTDQESVLDMSQISVHSLSSPTWRSYSLVAFNKELIETYLDIPWVETRCGYGCSDQ